MGQARKRGDYYQRREAAIERERVIAENAENVKRQYWESLTPEQKKRAMDTLSIMSRVR